GTTRGVTLRAAPARPDENGGRPPRLCYPDWPHRDRCCRTFGEEARMRVAFGLVVALAVVLMGAGPLCAQSLDPASSTALAATLQLLQDPAQRAAAIAGSPHAASVDAQMQPAVTPPAAPQ